LNLVSNALKFTDRKGSITIMAERTIDHIDPTQIISSNLEKPIVRVSVIDTGLGIKDKDKSKLFKLFGSVKDEKKGINTNGIGLGLVICQMIVAKFNGSIGFLSKYKKGSTFHFTFETEEFNHSSEQERIESSNLISKQASEDALRLFQSFTVNSEPQQTAFQTLVHLLPFQRNRILVVDDEEFCISAMVALLAKAGVNTND